MKNINKSIQMKMVSFKCAMRRELVEKIDRSIRDYVWKNITTEESVNIMLGLNSHGWNVWFK